MSVTAEAVGRALTRRAGPRAARRGARSIGLVCPIAATTVHVLTVAVLASTGIAWSRVLALFVLLAVATLVPLRPRARSVTRLRSLAVKDGLGVLARTAGAWLVATSLLPDVVPGRVVVGNLLVVGMLLAVEAGLRQRGAVLVVPDVGAMPTRGAPRIAKRGIDVVVTVFAGIVLLPFVVVAAAAIRLHDGGPILYRQERVGRDGRSFTLLKLRSMALDADARLAELHAANLRGGPLFKVAGDPRVTRVGRLLRATSLDEVPQLVNVLRGEMSLVGPRPALPREVAVFDDGLRRREQVLPGITGLWQVEDRGSSSFESYRDHDLFYVDNWSLGLDVSILASTATVVVRRALSIATGRTPSD